MSRTHLGRLPALQRATLTLSLATALASCGNLTANRFDPPPPSDKAGEVKGVPFTLNKPKLTVVRTSGANGAPDAYAIKAEYVPDPSQRFVLQLDPALLATVDWTMTFDDNGTLTDTNAKITDQTPTILMSLAKLAAAAATADTTGLSEEKAAQDIDTSVNQDLSANDPGLWDEDARTFRRIAPSSLPTERARWTALSARLQLSASYGQASRSFTYRTATERQLLITALQLQVRAAKPFSKPVSDGMASIDPAIKGPATEINDAMVAYDRKKLLKIRSDLQKARANLYARYAVTPPGELSELNNNRTILSMANDAISRIKANQAATLLLNILQIDAAEWQRRTIADLDQQIEQRKARLRAPVGGATVTDREDRDPVLTELLRQRAAVLGVLPEWDRRTTLRKVVTAQTGAGRFKEMSDEIAFLDKRLADADSTIKPAAAPDAKADDPAPAEFMLASPGQADAAWVVNQLDKVGVFNRPKYVVVFEPPMTTAPGTPPPIAPVRPNPQAPDTGNVPPTPVVPALK